MAWWCSSSSAPSSVSSAVASTISMSAGSPLSAGGGEATGCGLAASPAGCTSGTGSGGGGVTGGCSGGRGGVAAGGDDAGADSVGGPGGCCCGGCSGAAGGGGLGGLVWGGGGVTGRDAWEVVGVCCRCSSIALRKRRWKVPRNDSSVSLIGRARPSLARITSSSRNRAWSSDEVGASLRICGRASAVVLENREQVRKERVVHDLLVLALVPVDRLLLLLALDELARACPPEGLSWYHSAPWRSSSRLRRVSRRSLRISAMIR